ncbi:MAG: hypothetical protein M0Q91_17190 [Methanoregula sp.]|jgi:hypothetical protein|nr:hypothetical protein [Methanoregula sp.]
MDKKNISFLLSLYLAVFLTLLAAGFLFVFIINWEDWFFGIKLDGLPAGIYLFSKAVVAALLVYLLLKDESRKILWSVLSIGFLAFVFILPVFSSQRNLRNELGWTIFWAQLVVLIIIPVCLLIVYLVVNRMNRR